MNNNESNFKPNDNSNDLKDKFWKFYQKIRTRKIEFIKKL